MESQHIPTADAAADDRRESEIIVTDSAILKVHALIEEEGNRDLKLRIFVTGGGCSGFQYGFGFDEKANEDDFVIHKSCQIPDRPHDTASIVLVVDAQSFAYLKGASVDYRRDISGEQFIIRSNPNVKTTCGCGSSFAIAE